MFLEHIFLIRCIFSEHLLLGTPREGSFGSEENCLLTHQNNQEETITKSSDECYLNAGSEGNFEVNLTHLHAMFKLWINQVVGFYYQNL